MTNSENVALEEKALDKATFDFLEALTHINELIRRDVFGPERSKLHHDWAAFSTSAIICYGRPFKRSFGLPKLDKMLEENLSSEELLMHQNFINKRDQLVAHGDGNRFEIQKHNGDARSLHSDGRYLNEIEIQQLRQIAGRMLAFVTEIRTAKKITSAAEASSA